MSRGETADRAHANQFSNQFDTEETYPSGEDSAGAERPEELRGFAGMKAASRRWSTVAATCAALFSPSLLASPLPDGLPDLPGLSELMQRDRRSGLALRGFDPVAYRSEGRATPGLSEYELISGGIVWRFASAANLAAFRDAPAIYAPAFGGFDPVGIATGAIVDSDPHVFEIRDGRLFLFRNGESRARFAAELELLGKAEQRWPSLLVTLAR